MPGPGTPAPRPPARRCWRRRRREVAFGRAVPNAAADIPLMCRQLVSAHMLQTSMTTKPATPTQM